jgi:hypothetical protein
MQVAHLFSRRAAFGARAAMRATSTFLNSFEESVASLPMRESVRYKVNNMKLTAEELKVTMQIAHA